MALGSLRRRTVFITTAVICLLGAGAALAPGCVIRIGPGGPVETDASGGGLGGGGGYIGGGMGGAGAASGAGGSGIEDVTTEEDALYALENANPDALALTEVQAQYAAYACAGLVSADAGDPPTLDEATLQALADEYGPLAWEQAVEWGSTLDPSAIPLALVQPKYECEQQSGCSPTDTCKFDGYDKWAYCVVTGCGDGACPACPDIFDISKLVVKSWCSYTCMVNKQIVGIKIALNLQINRRWDKCIMLEKPVPCEGVCGT